MLIETERFGIFELKDKKTLRFPNGIPGFEELRSFILLETEENKPLLWLQSIENKHIALPVVIPFELIGDYYVDVRENELSDLNLEAPDDLLILCVVVIPEDVKKMTANLASPIVINAKRGIGKQLVIDAATLPLRFPIYDIIMQKLIGEGKANAGAVTQGR
ncbi:MAG: flagellar assembly protein FliW [Clostridiaceae bacterium]|nr:flagellar assembly protein FliW [Eubacteriales bacterium]